ncbi:MAG: CotH kinase family protein [Lachnospiraceae bacterium]
MSRKVRLSALLFISFVLLLLCTHFHLEAASLRLPAASVNHTLQDPWSDKIFESRSFSNLVVSIHADKRELYSEEQGILTSQYMLQGKEGERAIRIFVYDSDGVPLIAQNAGIRVSGATSRSAARKSFRVIARKDYDESFSKFTYDLWGGRQTIDGSGKMIREYSSFILHSMRLAMDSTGIHNSVGYSLARKAGISDAAPTVPAAVYINGEYQGAYFLLPAKNSHALAELYNIQEPDDIETVSVFEEEKTGFQTHPEVLEKYLQFVSFVQSADMCDPEVIEEIERQMDVRQCLQYYAVNLLLANGDWMDNNLRVWRCKNNGLPYQDGRWRFYLFDLDWIGSFPELVSVNFCQATQSNEYYNLLPSLLKNPDYVALFKDIIYQMEQDAFNSDSIESVFSEEDARILPEITYDYQSDAFCTYLQYSVTSDLPEEEEYLTLDDRVLMVEDFKSHMQKAPALINECLDIYYP